MMRVVIALRLLALVVIAMRLIELTGPAGTIIINSEQIVAMREPREFGHLGAEVKCVITTTDGRFFGVVQSCDEVRARLVGHD